VASPAKALLYLKNARSWDVTLDDLNTLARGVKNWSGFSSGVGELILQRKDELGEGGDEV